MNVINSGLICNRPCYATLDVGVSKSYDLTCIDNEKLCSPLLKGYTWRISIQGKNNSGPLRQCMMDRTCLFAYQLDLEKVSVS